MFFKSKEVFLTILENNIDRVKYKYNGIDDPIIEVDVCVDCDEKLKMINRGKCIEVSLGTIQVEIINKEISDIFEDLYHKNIKQVIYDFIFAIVDTEPKEDIYYKPILIDFYYDVLDMLESNKIRSTFLEFKNYTIMVDNIDEIKFYKINP